MTRRTKTLFWTGLGIYGLLLFLLLTLYRLPADKMLGKALTLFTENTDPGLRRNRVFLFASVLCP